MLPLLAALAALPPCIMGLQFVPVPPSSFPNPYTEPYVLPSEWMLDASFEARKKSKQGFNLWVANGDRNPPGDFDGMRINFGQVFVEMFMNDRSPQTLNPVASCPWDASVPHRIKLEQHSGDLKLSVQERGGPWTECFKLEEVGLPEGYSINFDGQLPTVASLDLWRLEREGAHASAGQQTSESHEALMASVQRLSHQLEAGTGSSGGDNAALEKRLAAIESHLASLDSARGTEVRELAFVKDKLETIQVGLPDDLKDTFAAS